MNCKNPQKPFHVALIMDGNGRWAAKRNKKRAEGHTAGIKHLRSIIKTFFSNGASHLSFYGFSTENWSRPKSEVSGIFSLLVKSVDDQLQEITDMRLKFIHLGDKRKLPNNVKNALIKMETNANYPDYEGTLALAFNYGSRSEIVDAANMIATKYKNPNDIDQNTLTEHLQTKNLPKVDLLIRTGGEKRLSNFLLLQSVNAEFVSTDTLWPDFTSKHVEGILKSHQRS